MGPSPSRPRRRGGGDTKLTGGGDGDSAASGAAGTSMASRGTPNGRWSRTETSGAARSAVSDAKQNAEAVRHAVPAAPIQRRSRGRTRVPSARDPGRLEGAGSVWVKGRGH